MLASPIFHAFWCYARIDTVISHRAFTKIEVPPRPPSGLRVDLLVRPASTGGSPAGLPYFVLRCARTPSGLPRYRMGRSRLEVETLTHFGDGGRNLTYPHTHLSVQGNSCAYCLGKGGEAGQLGYRPSIQRASQLGFASLTLVVSQGSPVRACPNACVRPG